MKLFTLAFAALVTVLTCVSAQAQTYPAKPVRMLVGYPPGGLADLVARILAQKLSESWGQTVVVENRTGATGTIAADLAAKSAPDGYTLLASPQSSLAIAPSLYGKLPYDPLHDFAPIMEIGSSPLLLVAHPSLPVKNFKDFARLVKANWKQMSYASGGVGTTPHLTGELLNSMLGVRVLHVPYKGESVGIADVLGGQVPYMFCNLPVGLPQVRAGKLLGLAISSLKRTPLAPDIPTVAEASMGDFEATTWIGLYAPAATARPIIDRVHAEAAKALGTPDSKQRFAAQGVDVVAGTPEQLAEFLRSETTKRAKVVKDSGARAD